MVALAALSLLRFLATVVLVERPHSAFVSSQIDSAFHLAPAPALLPVTQQGLLSFSQAKGLTHTATMYRPWLLFYPLVLTRGLWRAEVLTQIKHYTMAPGIRHSRPALWLKQHKSQVQGVNFLGDSLFSKHGAFIYCLLGDSFLRQGTQMTIPVWLLSSPCLVLEFPWVQTQTMKVCVWLLWHTCYTWNSSILF